MQLTRLHSDKSHESILKSCVVHFRYDEAGNTHGRPEIIPPSPTRLAWDFHNEQLLKTIDEAYDDAQKVLSVSQSFPCVAYDY